MAKYFSVMSSPPNTFLQFWTADELRHWWHELTCRERNRSPEYDFLNVPTKKQVRAEFRRRGITVRGGKNAKL